VNYEYIVFVECKIIVWPKCSISFGLMMIMNNELAAKVGHNYICTHTHTHTHTHTQTQGGSNMTGTDVARFTHKQSRSYLNHLVYRTAVHLCDVSKPTSTNMETMRYLEIMSNEF